MFLQNIYRRFGIHYYPDMTILDVGGGLWTVAAAIALSWCITPHADFTLTDLFSAANIGVYAFYVAKQCGGAVRVHCFEPMAPVFSLLAKNAEELNAGAHTAWIGDAPPGAKIKLAVHAVQLGCYNERKDVVFSWRPNCPVAVRSEG